MSGYDPKKTRGHRDAAPEEPAPVDALLGPGPGEPDDADTAPVVGEPAAAAAVAPVPGAPVAADDPAVDAAAVPLGDGVAGPALRAQVAALELEAEVAARLPEPTPVAPTTPSARRAPASVPPEPTPGAAGRPPVAALAAVAAALAVLVALVVTWLRRRR